MRRSATLAVMVSAVALGVAADAAAQTVETNENGSLRATIGGTASFWFVNRDPFFDALFPRGAVPLGGRARRHAETFVDAFASVDLDFTFKNNIGFFLQIETAPDAAGGEAHRFGDNGQALQFNQMFLRMEDLLTQRLDLRLGIQNLREDFRPQRGHGAFFLDVANSEDPFTGAVHTASGITVGGTLFATGVPASVSGTALPGALGVTIGSPLYGQPADTDPGLSEQGWNPYLGGNPWYNNQVGQSKTSEFGGAVLSYEPIEKAFFLRGFAGTYVETGTAQKDGQLFGLIAELRFQIPSGAREHGSSVRAMFARLASSPPIGINSFGASVDLWVLNDYLEAYGEFVGQTGTYTRFGRSGASVGLASNSTRQKSYAWCAGGRIEVPLADLGATNLGSTAGQYVFLDCAYWHLSGDGGNPYQANEDYVSFESVDSAMILEGSQYGLDVDTNYWAIKGEGGVATDWGSLSLFIGMYRLNRPPAGNVGSGSTIKQRLGNETDIRLRIHASENVELMLGLGFLTDSNFWKTATAVRAGTIRPSHSGGDAQLVTIGAKVRF